MGILHRRADGVYQRMYWDITQHDVAGVQYAAA